MIFYTELKCLKREQRSRLSKNISGMVMLCPACGNLKYIAGLLTDFSLNTRLDHNLQGN